MAEINELKEIELRIASLERTVALLEHTIETMQQQQASREWIREMITPIQSAVARMEPLVAGLQASILALSDEHQGLLKDKAEAERQHLETLLASSRAQVDRLEARLTSTRNNRSFKTIVKDYILPGLGIASFIAGAVAGLAKLIQWLINLK